LDWVPCFYTLESTLPPSHIDIPHLLPAVGFGLGLRTNPTALQPCPQAVFCVEALEDREGRSPALPLLDREIFIYPAVHFWIFTVYILALSTLAGAEGVIAPFPTKFYNNVSRHVNLPMRY
jgi:hypothetical protein